MVLKSLAADDIFISYSRRDSSASEQTPNTGATRYAIAPADDILGTEANPELHPKLLENLRGCRMLVVLCTEGPIVRPFVGQEAHEFVNAKGSTSMMVPVIFDSNVMKADWYKVIEGIAPQYEDVVRLQTGEPSEEVLTRIEDAFKYSKSKERLRRATRWATVTLGLLLVLIVAASAVAITCLIRPT